MAPSDYTTARNNPQETRVTVDGKPYLPFLSTDSNNLDTVKKVVAEIFVLPSWEHFQVQPVTGGITNTLFKVSGLKEQSDQTDVPDAVLVRIFGGEGMIDRDIETSTYATLAEQGIALGYYGRFENGRLEEWCDHMHSLEVKEMGVSDISKGIAKSVAAMHANFTIPSGLKKHHDPSSPPTLWTQLTGWLDKALDSQFQNDHDTKRAQDLELSKLKEEIDWLKTSVISPDCKVGFCHNDLLAANIMWDKNTKDIQLIDFEYGGINYLSYDIANHFNEFAGGTEGDATPDYGLFPSPALQRDFVTEYLTATTHGTEPSSEKIDALLTEIKGFVLANHLVWGLWGVNQAATEGCVEFDYLKYGSYRIQRYYNDKKE
jgi:ethanolamine kinase